MINNINLSATPIKPTTSKEDIQNTKPNFGKINIVEKADSFEPSSGNKTKQKSKSELALIALTSASVAALTLFRGKMGKALKLVGEKAPLTMTGRMKKLSDIASKDGMTGLFNKKALLSNLTKEYNKAVKTDKNLSVAMLDMDNFKGINEIFSHDVGDTVLKRIASNIQEVATKHGASGFRYGGEEFVITMADKNAASSKKIVAEISDAIKNDEVIQGYLPKFLKKANADLEFITPKVSQIDSMFAKLRGEIKIEDPQKLADEMVSLIETHIKKYNPSDTNTLDSLINTIKSAKPEDLPNILKVKTKVGKEGTIGGELNKIQSQYRSIKHDLQKWTNHIEEHKLFTVSGGVINLKDTSLIKDGKTMVKVADAALKSAKENGKNVVVTANDDIVKKTIEQLRKNQT